MAVRLGVVAAAAVAHLRCGDPAHALAVVRTVHEGASAFGPAVLAMIDVPGERADRCPTCRSPAPHLHPAVQFEGEAQPCPDPWHGRARRVPAGTVYACPGCGGTAFDEWDWHDVRFRGVTVQADAVGAPGLEHNDYSGGWTSGETYNLDTLTCLGCGRTDLQLRDLVPVAPGATVSCPECHVLPHAPHEPTCPFVTGRFACAPHSVAAAREPRDPTDPLWGDA